MWPAQAGDYAFRLTFRDASGQSRSESVRLNVPTAAASNNALRMGHAVRMGGQVSVRAWPGSANASIQWQQVDGPSVSLDTTNPLVAHFKAPTVERDTAIRLRASFNGGDSDEVVILVEKHQQARGVDSSSTWVFGGQAEHISRVYPYLSNSPHAANLVACVYDSSQTRSNPCLLSRLPVLAQETAGQLPTIDQVMNRVVVCHDWMGQNFRRFLEAHDSQGAFRRMLMSTTAVVIGAQVRPSFYYAATGAIYLDADNFWLTAEERDTVNEAPDYRSSFGKTLAYDMLGFYTEGNALIYGYYRSDARVNRTVADLFSEAGPLMYHELAHALDFLPPAAYPALNSNASLLANIGNRQSVSDRVTDSHPLVSSEMKKLGQIKFQDPKLVTDTEKGYTAQQVAGFFAPDFAVDEYAYSSPAEDVAMLYEEVLLTRLHAYRRNVAILPAIAPEGSAMSTAVVWGQRGRIGDPRLHPRARIVMGELAPWFNSNELAQLPLPTPMRAGETLSANLMLNGAPLRKPFAAGGAMPTAQQFALEQALTKRRHRHPAHGSHGH